MLVFGIMTAVFQVINESIGISRDTAVYTGRKMRYEILKNILEMLLVIGEVYSFLKVCKCERHHIIASHQVVYHTKTYY